MRRVLSACSVAASLIFVSAHAEDMAPEKVPGVVTVDVKTAKAHYDKGAPFVDTRSTADWDAGRIAGAVHLDSKKITEADLLKVGKKDELIVLYCNGVKCLRSSEAATKAVAWGFTNLHYLRDGLPAWKAANYPVE